MGSILDQEDPLEKEMAIHSSILAWRIPCAEEPSGLWLKGTQRVGHDWATNTFTFIHSFILNISVRYFWMYVFSSVQSFNHVWLLMTPWTAARQASLSIAKFQSLLKLMPIKLVMPSNRLNLWCPLLLLPSVLPSIRFFSNPTYPNNPSMYHQEQLTESVALASRQW